MTEKCADDGYKQEAFVAFEEIGKLFADVEHTQRPNSVHHPLSHILFHNDSVLLKMFSGK